MDWDDYFWVGILLIVLAFLIVVRLIFLQKRSKKYEEKERPVYRRREQTWGKKIVDKEAEDPILKEVEEPKLEEEVKEDNVRYKDKMLPRGRITKEELEPIYFPKMNLPVKKIPPGEPAEVNLSVNGPQRVKSNSSFLLDIWAFQLKDKKLVDELANATGRDSVKGLAMGLAVELGEQLQIEIAIPGMIILEPIGYLTWSGTPANTSFLIQVPSKLEIGEYPGSATISIDGLRIHKLWFTVAVTTKEDSNRKELQTEKQKIQSAFASYASRDRANVLSRIQGIKKVAPDMDIFLDVISLRSGDDWEEKLNKHVPSKDIFYLFWSKSASKSNWVEREWKMALSKRGIDYIDPVPLDSPDLAPPPKELGKLHFNDAYLAHIKYEEIKQQLKNEGKQSDLE